MQATLCTSWGGELGVIAELGWSEASQQGQQPSTGSEQGGQVRVDLDLSSVNSEELEGKEVKCE